MATISDVTAPGDSFPLGRLLADDPDVFIEIERLVPLEDRLLPYFWVSDGSPGHVEETLESQSAVESIERLADVEDRSLYQVRWAPGVGGFVDTLLDTDGAIMEGTGIDGSWTFRLRFPDQERLRRFLELCDEGGIELELNDVYDPHAPPIEDRLSATQWRTLTAAYEMGVFEVPREATLSELGDRLGVSKQAASGRVRRAMREVVGAMIYDPSEPPRD